MPIWLQVLGVAVVFVGFLGAATVYLRGSKDAGTITTLKANNEALTARVAILEKSDTEKEHTIGVLQARLTACERENVSLAAQRPSAEAITDIHALLSMHDKETRALLMAMATSLTELTSDDQ